MIKVSPSSSTGSATPFFLVVLASASLIVSGFQGIFAVVVDTDVSGVFQFESNEYLVDTPSAANLQTALSPTPHDCTGVTFSDGGIPGSANSIVIDINEWAQPSFYSLGTWCVTNVGGESGLLEFEVAGLSSADPDCDSVEPTAGDTSDCEPDGELHSLIHGYWFEFGTDCDNAQPLNVFSLQTTVVLDNTFDPGETCHITPQIEKELNLISETQLARASTDTFGISFQFIIDDGS